MNNSQRGWSTSQVMFWVLIFAFALTIFFKLAPVYIDDYTGVKGTFDQLAREDLSSMKKSQIKQKFMKYYQLNRVGKEASEALKVVPTKGGYKVTDNYEVRVPLFGNMDAVMRFEHELLTANTAQ